jgi:hypothetical protein
VTNQLTDGDDSYPAPRGGSYKTVAAIHASAVSIRRPAFGRTPLLPPIFIESSCDEGTTPQRLRNERNHSTRSRSILASGLRRKSYRKRVQQLREGTLAQIFSVLPRAMARRLTVFRAIVP